MVPKDAAPKSYKDLLNPKWKGAIGMDNEPYNWYVITLRYLERRDGKEAALDYMKKLAAQQIQWRKGHSLIGQLMAAGEFPIAAELQVHTVERAKAQGAPVEPDATRCHRALFEVLQTLAVRSPGDGRLR